MSKEFDSTNIASPSEHKMLKGFDAIKAAIIRGKFKVPYIDMVKNHLHYLGVSDMDLDKYKEPGVPISSLDQEIQDKIGHLLPFSLMSSILAYATNVGGEVSEEDLQSRLSVNKITSSSVRNLVTPNSDVVNPNNFRSRLYPPQAAVLKRMLDFEPVRSVNFMKKDLYMRAGVVSEKVGFGKTYLCCALLAHKPEIDKEYLKKISVNEPGIIIPKINPLSFLDSPTEKMNIVISNFKTAKEWETNLKNLTNLSVMKITSKKMLETFIERYNSRDIPDVLLVKDGKIDGKLLVDTLVGILGDKVSNRVIIDDYDLLNMDKYAALPNAVFYWFISSTREFGNKKGNKYKSENVALGRFSISDMERYMELFDLFANIKCIDGFTSKEYEIPKIDVYSRKTDISKILCDKCTKYNRAVELFEEHLKVSKVCDEIDAPQCDVCDYYIAETQENYPTDLDITFKCKVCKEVLYKNVMLPLEKEVVDFVKGNHRFEKVEHPSYFVKLLRGTVDLPPKKGVPIKALILAKEFSDRWEARGLKSVVISNSNISSFETSDCELGICSGLSGVNLKYLTHIIVLPGTSPDTVAQFIGRGQRLGRTQNLQVLFA
jgi:hypothetical protein